MLVQSTLLSFLAAIVMVQGFSTLQRPISLKRSLDVCFAVKDSSEVESYLTTNYIRFSSLLLKQETLWKRLREADRYTILAPTVAAFDALGTQRWLQLQDPRNSETTEKICAFHCINEPVSAQELFDCGGLVSLGGTLPVTRSVTGGVFGVGGREDGGVKVQGAKVLKTVEVANCIIHEVDSLVAPQVIWRFMDQLRIPFSK